MALPGNSYKMMSCTPVQSMGCHLLPSLSAPLVFTNQQKTKEYP